MSPRVHKLKMLARLIMANLQPHAAVGQLAVRATVIDLQACSRAHSRVSFRLRLSIFCLLI